MENTTAKQGLALVEMTESHWPFFRALHCHSDVMQYISDPMSEGDIRQKFDRRLKSDEREGQYVTCRVLCLGNDTPLGLYGYEYQLNEGRGEAELGYMLAPEFQGMGYGYNGLLLLLDWLSGIEQITHLHARVAEPNRGSVRLLEKCGFSCQGRKFTGLELAGEPVADWLYHKPNRASLIRDSDRP